MAIDTAAKRAAALGAGLSPGVLLPIPDGTIDANDRAQLAGVALPSGAAPPEDRLTINVNAGIIPIKAAADVLLLRFDWSDALDDGVALASVEHTVSSPLVRDDQSTDTVSDTSDLDVSGGTHGATYQIGLLATLSNGTTLQRTWPIRVSNT